jgi:hypothetical protein
MGSRTVRLITEENDMFRYVLKDKSGSVLMERFGDDLKTLKIEEYSALTEILLRGGHIEITYVGQLQKCTSDEGFI